MMSLTSFNIRGLRDGLKKSSLRRLFLVIKPDIVLIQETMSLAWKSCHYFLSIFPGWEVPAYESCGLSGGLLCIWNPALCDFTSFSSSAGILMVGRLKGFEEEVRIHNIYGPYKDKEPFW